MTQITSWKNKKARIFKELVAILGEKNVSENLAVRAGYRLGERSVQLGKPPEIVAIPRSVEHVQEIVKLANKEKVTLLPICSGTLTPGSDVDILLDMMGMDKILKIDTENSYVLLEPGVTFSHLDPILRKEGFTIARGTCPVSLSVVGHLAICRTPDHNFTARNGNQTLGIEVVLFDGTLLRTGLATLGMDYWQYSSRKMPDLKGIFVNAHQKAPTFGIITKAALKIWPIMEARALPIGGFDNFASAFKYCKAVANGGIVDQATIWNWILVGLGEVRAQKKGGKYDIDFLTHRMKAGYNEPYKGLYNYYAISQCRGYKEQVEANLKLCKRIAKEHGGKILSDEELQNTIPNVWERTKQWYEDFDFDNEKKKAPHMWRIGGEGQANSWYIQGWIDDLIKVENAIGRRLREKYNILPIGLICRVYEPGVGGHLSFILGSDLFDEYQSKRHAKIRQEMNAWIIENFPNVLPNEGVKNIGTYPNTMKPVLDKIRDVLDPNHIGYMAREKRLDRKLDDEDKVSATG